MNDSIKYSFVDVAKGVTIILMVIGHSSIPEVLSRWIWSFHMPFFFIISGLFVRWDKKNESVGSFIKRKASTLLIPFIIYSCINLSLFPFCNGLSHLEYLQNVLKSGWGGVALWFIPVFFSSLIICKITPEKFLTPAGLTLLVIGCILSLFYFELPWDISTIPFAASLMLLSRRNRRYIKMVCMGGG